jgi:uncharacterized protein YcbK (DUF882 family)
MVNDLYDYSQWPNFTREELICQYTSEENPNVDAFTRLMDNAQELRTWAGVPFQVPSAYRSPIHPKEVCKSSPGQHSKAALDIRVPTQHCHRIVAKAFELGFTGIGINLIGAKGTRFIHLDRREGPPRIWSY